MNAMPDVIIKGTHSRVDIFHLKMEPEAILYEEVDHRALYYIHSLTSRSDTHNKKTEKMLKGLGADKADEKVLQLAEFHKVRTHTPRKVHYKVSAESAGIPGRLYAGLSCQSPWRPVRNILIGDTTWDADQKDCWMRTLVFICRELEAKEWTNVNDALHPIKKEFRTTWLEKWIANKKAYISQWCDAKSKTPKFCKETLAACANWGGSYKTGFEPFTALDKELKDIMASFRPIPEFKRYYDFMEKRKEETGKCETIIGILTKAIEANNTWACVREWQAHGFKVCTVVHDGMNLYKTEESSPEFVVSLFDAVSQIVAPGSAKWEIKPPDFRVYNKDGVPHGTLKVPDDYIMSAEEDGDNEPRCPCGCEKTEHQLMAMEGKKQDKQFIAVERSYAGMKQMFEQLHCQVHCQFIDEEKNSGEPVVLKKEELVTKCQGRIRYSTHVFDRNGNVSIIRSDFVPTWLKDEDKRYLRRYDTYPKAGSCPVDVYNMWRGFAVEKALHSKTFNDFTQEDVRGCAFFLRHVHRLIDDDFRDFFFDFWAHMLIYPEIKPGILVGLLGHKRIGKGQTIDMMHNLVGKQAYMMTSQPSRDIWGRNGTDCTNGKILIRLAEPKRAEYMSDPGFRRVWITDNPVPIKAMHHRMETVTNFSRFIHDGNDPILPDEESDGRIAQTLCNPYWKNKFSPEEFVQYNTELGAHIENENVQLLLYFILLKQGCPKRFSFHVINKCTGAFAKQERKNNRTLLEKFLVYLCDEQPWNKQDLELYESDEREEDVKRDQGISSDTIEYYLTNWARHQHFEKPVKCRTITMELGKWVAMKHGGVRSCRAWDHNLNRNGRHRWVFDLDFLRSKFSLDQEKKHAEAEARKQKVKCQRTEETLDSWCSVCECTCDSKLCLLNDAELLQSYIRGINEAASKEALEDWIATKKPPLIWEEEEERDDKASCDQALGEGRGNRYQSASTLTEQDTEAFVMGYRDKDGTPLTTEYLNDKEAGWTTRAFYSTILYGANSGDKYPTFEDGTVNMHQIVRNLLHKWPNYLEQYMPTICVTEYKLETTAYYQYLK